MSDGINKLDSRMKIGARVLNDISMKVLLPNYENIFEQITEIRENASSLKEARKSDREYREILKKEPEFAKHHNNVFSILGERGSGKTSVQLTLKYFIMECLQKQGESSNNKVKDEIRNAVSKNIKPNDTVLPIIVPQDMDADSNSMGWIIGFFNEIAKEVEKEYQQNRSLFQYKDDKCYACGSGNQKKSINYITQSLEKVRKAYFLRQEQYKKLLTDVSSKKEYVDENSETLMKDIDLVKAFKEFIDEYVGLKRSQNNGEEPLVYIFFDDVDISTKKCIDVLETIMRFLSHSNIVVFVAGNNKTFKETIVIDYLKDEGLLNEGLMNSCFEEEEKTALKTRKILAYDYLKKVLSPALRYEMQVLSDTEKVEFKYNAVNKSDDTYKTLYKLIVECFGLEEKNFLVFNGKEKLTPYFMIFDNKPRGLMNVYYYLNGKAQRLKELKKGVNEDEYRKVIRGFWKASELERLLDLIIESSSELNIYREKIKKVIGIEDEKIKINVEELDVEFDNNELKFNITMLAFFIKGVALEELNREDLKASMAKKLSDTLLSNVKISELKKQEKERKYNFFFETDTVENNIYLFLKMWEGIKNRNLNEKDFFDFYLENLYKMININSLSIQKYKNIIVYLNSFFYDSKTKLNRIIENIVKFKDVKSIRISQERKLYFNNFYLNDSLEFILNSNSIKELLLEDKLMEVKGLNTEKSIFLEEVLENKKLYIDRTLRKIIDNFKQEMNKVNKKIDELVMLTESENTLKNIREKIKEEFELEDLIEDHVFNDSELDFLEKISELEIIDDDIEGLKDIIDSSLNKEWGEIKVKLENRKIKIKEIENRENGKEEITNLDLLKLYLKPIQEKKWTNLFKEEVEIRKILLSAFLLIEEYRKMSEINFNIESLLDEDLKKYYDFLQETYTDFYEKKILKKMFEKNKDMEISDYEFFIDILMDDILDIEDEFKKEDILIGIKNLEEKRHLKEIFGEGIINEENLINMNKLKKWFFNERKKISFNNIKKESLRMRIGKEKYMIIRKYMRAEKKIKEIEKLKFKTYVDIFNSLQSLKYDREKRKQQNDEISKIYNGVYKEIKENKKLSRFLPLEVK